MMMKKLGLLIIVCVMALAGCSQQESKVTLTVVPTLTPTPTPTPSLGGRVVHGGHCSPVVPINLYFIEGYNVRDASQVVEAFNSTVMGNHSIRDIEMELEFAEEHDVFVIGIESGSVNDVPRDETEVLLDVSGVRVNTSINFSLRCIDRVENKPDVDWADKVIHHELKMTAWPFDDIRKAVKDISAPNKTSDTPEQRVLQEFFDHFNHRNATSIYSLYSERIRDDYTLREVNRTLDSAEDTVLNVDYSRLESNETLVVNVSTIKTEGVKPNGFDGPTYLLLNFSFDYRDSQPRVDNWVLDSLVDLKGSE